MLSHPPSDAEAEASSSSSSSSLSTPRPPPAVELVHLRSNSLLVLELPPHAARSFDASHLLVSYAGFATPITIPLPSDPAPCSICLNRYVPHTFVHLSWITYPYTVKREEGDETTTTAATTTTTHPVDPLPILSLATASAHVRPLASTLHYVHRHAAPPNAFYVSTWFGSDAIDRVPGAEWARPYDYFHAPPLASFPTGQYPRSFGIPLLPSLTTPTPTPKPTPTSPAPPPLDPCSSSSSPSWSLPSPDLQPRGDRRPGLDAPTPATVVVDHETDSEGDSYEWVDVSRWSIQGKTSTGLVEWADTEELSSAVVSRKGRFYMRCRTEEATNAVRIKTYADGSGSRILHRRDSDQWEEFRILRVNGQRTPRAIQKELRQHTTVTIHWAPSPAQSP